jgi:ribosomal protein S12 methylthiotransferase accessory factor
MKNLFSNAASLMLGEAPEAGAIHDAHLLLTELGYRPPAGAGPDHEAGHRARLLKAASQFIRIFELAAPEAPRLIAFGAEFDPAIADALHRGSPPVGVSGIGQTMQEAFQGCVGEGIEYLSQLQHAGDALVQTDGDAPTAALDRPARELVTALQSRARGALTWHRAKHLSDGREVLLPADLCLRRPPAAQDFAPPFPLSTGSAAGTSWHAAALHGLFELIERDAASLWWRGGRRGHAVAPESEAGQHAAELLAHIRQGMQNRASWLLDITTDVGVPCVVAVSATLDGFGFSCGVAARLTMSMAAQSAIFEMCQSELAHAVVEAKRHERGDAALNARDLAHLRRRTGLDTRTCALLHPLPPRGHTLEHDDEDTARTLRVVVDRLAGMGLETFAVDLTRRTFALPVVRIVAPGLQLEPSEIVGERLAATRVETGGGEAHTCGVALF